MESGQVKKYLNSTPTSRSSEGFRKQRKASGKTVLLKGREHRPLL
jgi:hypothetical protein